MSTSTYKQLNCFVAFLDILGFKEMVERNEFDKLMRIYENFFLSNAALAAAGGTIKLIETDKGQRATADLTKATVECLIVSDSVLLWTSDNKMTSFIELCIVVAKLIFAGIRTGLPIRGAMTTGTLGVFNASLPAASSFGIHSVVGKPLVHAYREERSYEWVGCVIDDACLSVYSDQFAQLIDTHLDLASIEFLSESGLIARYVAPHKAGAKETWVVDWPRLNGTSVTAAHVGECFGMHEKPTDDDLVKLKLANTISFIEFSEARKSER